MSAPIVKLFTQPNFAWTDIRREEEAHPRHYLAHLLLLALIPAVCLFIGTTYVGWSLAENETVKLSTQSALQLCVLLYVTIIAGVALMGGFIRWMSRTFDARPTINQCIGFAAYTATPFFLAGIAGLYPSLAGNHCVDGCFGLFDVFAVRRLADVHARAQGTRLAECGVRLGRRAPGIGDYSGRDDSAVVQRADA